VCNCKGLITIWELDDSTNTSKQRSSHLSIGVGVHGVQNIYRLLQKVTVETTLQVT